VHLLCRFLSPLISEQNFTTILFPTSIYNSLIISIRHIQISTLTVQFFFLLSFIYQFKYEFLDMHTAAFHP